MQNERDMQFQPAAGYGIERGGEGGLGDEATTAARETMDELRRGDARSAMETGRERASELTEHGKQRAGEMAERGKDRVADQAERMGERLHERAHRMEQQGGMQAKAAGAAHRASEALEGGADYLRSHEMTEMRGDLERQIRSNPLLSVGVALGAGFLLGRMLD